MIAEWKRFSDQVELLLDGGPYTGMEEKQKVNTLLNWMTDKGQKIYKEQLIFPTEEPDKKDKSKLKDVLEVFETHFTPLQSMIHSWYNLGALHSHHCKDQADFMSQLRSLSKDCAFTNADEVVKFLFLIHNSHKRVQDQLLKDVTKNSSLTDCLLKARRIEAHIQMEKLAHKMHNNMSDNVSVDAFKKSQPGRGRGHGAGRGHGRGRGGGRGGYQHRSQSGYRHTSLGRQGKCGNCGTLHPPRRCPAYGQNCYTCGKTGHYSRYCRSKHRSSTPGRRSRREMHDLEPDEEYEYDTIQIIRKVKFSSSCHKEHNSNKNNVMFDEIADVPKRNLRMLSDLYAESCSRKDTIRFKLDTGAGGNMLPYDTWREFFPGQSSTALAKTIDRGVTLQAYNKSEIRQLGTCNLKISHSGTTRTCHFFIVPSQYRPILGLNDLMALNLVTFNCPTTTSWRSTSLNSIIKIFV